MYCMYSTYSQNPDYIIAAREFPVGQDTTLLGPRTIEVTVNIMIIIMKVETW